MSLNKKTLLAVLVAVCGAAMSHGAAAATCPTPTLPDQNTFAHQYDQGWSYSIDINDAYYPTAGWDCSAGTGTLDIIVTTRSAGQQNPGAIPDPTTNTNISPINGYVDGNIALAQNFNNTWGGGSTSDTQMKVVDLYSYLQTNFNATRPMVTFDQNETGGNGALWVALRIDIVDSTNSSIAKTWSLDVYNNGTFDFDPLTFNFANCQEGATSAATCGGLIQSPFNATYPTANAGDLCYPDPDPDHAGQTICESQNRGSGHFDYLVDFPSMDLTPYLDPKYLFKMTWYFYGVDDGGEEITLTGRFSSDFCAENPTSPQCQTVPEPNSLALLGLALGFLGFASRRRKVL